MQSTIVVNGRRRELDAHAVSLLALVRQLGLEGKRIAVERNGEIVPRGRYGATPLQAGDRLEVVHAVGGG